MVGVEKAIGMALGHEKLDSASEGMLFARNRAITERKKSTPIPTPTPKEAMTDNHQPPAGGDGIPRLYRDVPPPLTGRQRMIEPICVLVHIP
ncbi:MAG: hypothetical protein ACOYOU_20965, partial [Kiritimatiellia bacterium]